MPIYNKITVNDEVIIDLTQDTITKEKVPSGLTFHDKSGAVQTGTMAAQEAKTITPSTSAQTAVASGVYTTGAVTVAPIPSNYEDVANETNAYTEKLEQLTTAVTALEEELAGKAGGEASEANLDVCTVELTGFNISRCEYIIYTSVENNAIVTKLMHSDSSIWPDPTDCTITCLCGSVLILSIYSGNLAYTNLDLLVPYRASMYIFKASAINNSQATLTLTKSEVGGGN